MEHCHIFIHGYVQGVGYRNFARRTALVHGITGWVRNDTDGTVEIDAQGDDMDDFIEALKIGCAYASVISVDVTKIPGTAAYSSFYIAQDR
jgi:acylphosphatase